MHRLALVRRMRPLGFCLEDVRALLGVLEKLPGTGGPAPGTDEETHEELVATLRKYWVRADERCEDLRQELSSAEEFARSLHGHLSRPLEATPVTGEEVVR